MALAVWRIGVSNIHRENQNKLTNRMELDLPAKGISEGSGFAAQSATAHDYVRAHYRPDRLVSSVMLPRKITRVSNGIEREQPSGGCLEAR